MGRRKEKETFGEFWRQKKSVIVLLLTLALLCGGLLFAYTHIIKNYSVTRIYVDGNYKYTNEEIIDMVMQGPFSDNSLILSWRYKDKSIEGIPFIERIDVSVQDKDAIRISVYEKAVAGYVEFLGYYLYFDREGIIVEGSDEKKADIPEVAGLEFDYALLHEKLPVKDTAVFAVILNLRHLLEQHDVAADRIYINRKGEITLSYGDVLIALGDVLIALGDVYHVDDKIMALENILPSLSGAKGVLRMENYDEYSAEIIFESRERR